jgi:hypothetical protein
MKKQKSIGSNIAKSVTSHNRTAFIGSGGIFMEEIWKDIEGFEKKTKLFGVNNATVHYIVKNKTWKHLL